jgi:hypothetical protein
MHPLRPLIGLFGAALVGTTLAAQAAVTEMDGHINTARTAAGLDYP